MRVGMDASVCETSAPNLPLEWANKLWPPLVCVFARSCTNSQPAGPGRELRAHATELAGARPAGRARAAKSGEPDGRRLALGLARV